MLSRLASNHRLLSALPVQLRAFSSARPSQLHFKLHPNGLRSLSSSYLVSFPTTTTNHRLFSTETDDKSKTDSENDQNKDENSKDCAATEEATGADPNAEELERVKTELAETKEQFLRALAEHDNARKRDKKELENKTTFAIQSFAKQLLDVSDNLTRAITSVPEDELEKPDADKNLLALYEGLSMTKKGLDGVFAKNDVQEFGEIGEKFDPNLHNALFTLKAEEGKVKGTIGQVIKTGYKFRERVLRPADVGTIQ